MAVVGASTNSTASHRRFATNQELDYPLLADTDGAVAAAYGVLRAGGRFAERATFLIDREGVIRHVWPKVKVAGHADEVLSKAVELL